MKRKLLLILFASIIALSASGNDSLKLKSKYEVGQIEVGGPYAGIEIHKSFPMINRISFYYPVANSIDVSEDYWKRENYRIMSMGLKIGNRPKFILNEEPWEVIQSPYDVEFHKEIENSNITIKYEFCKNKPAMCASYHIENNSDSTKLYEVYLRYETIIRTSHTYELIDSGKSHVRDNGKLITINYDIPEAGNSQIFFYNTGELPLYAASNFNKDKYEDPDDYWLNTNESFEQENYNAEPAAAFVYKKELKPGESLNIVQLIGSVKINESEDLISYLSQNYRKEIDEYENYILNNSLRREIIKTGNPSFDFTTDWALAVLKTNAHYLDGEIVPMPAQAEYNFYFTHDALLTDLAAVNFDLNRVKNDLEFIIKLADNNNVIPHAYYWKDGKYKTEYAGTENWNHFWFTLLSARYLRHSNDTQFANKLYPYVKQSIETALKNKENNLMYSFRPDWWDIGNNYGPRAYMTILAIKALQEFNYFHAELNIDPTEIQYYKNIADTLHSNLINKLWNEELNYLTSFYEDGSEDKHIYMGSMLASHFNLLDATRNEKLMKTAKKYLLDENLGVYTLYPMDLHKLVDYMGFAGNEAGDPSYYANGGIWPHGNAWYVLGLISNKKYEEAYDFIEKIMTLDGVINSPNGQPAMYEYRISDKSNPEVYGKIDKPQFLWAAGWYIYSLYNLFGVKENNWNISIQPFLLSKIDSVNFNLSANGMLFPISIKGEGNYIQSFNYKKKIIPSYVLPDDMGEMGKISIKLGRLEIPMILSAEAKIGDPQYSNKEKTLSFMTKSYEGNEAEIEIVSPNGVLKILNDGKMLNTYSSQKLDNGNYKIVFTVEQKAEGNKIELLFQ